VLASGYGQLTVVKLTDDQTSHLTLPKRIDDHPNSLVGRASLPALLVQDIKGSQVGWALPTFSSNLLILKHAAKNRQEAQVELKMLDAAAVIAI
jgi:hypothetical protein